MLLDKSFHKFPLRLFWESIFHSFTRETIQIGKGKAAEAQIRKKLYKKNEKHARIWKSLNVNMDC